MLRCEKEKLEWNNRKLQEKLKKVKEGKSCIDNQFNAIAKNRASWQRAKQFHQREHMKLIKEQNQLLLQKIMLARTHYDCHQWADNYLLKKTKAEQNRVKQLAAMETPMKLPDIKKKRPERRKKEPRCRSSRQYLPLISETSKFDESSSVALADLGYDFPDDENSLASCASLNDEM